jgi:cyclase
MLKKRIITTMLWNGFTLVKGKGFDNLRSTGHPLTTMQVYNNRDVDEIIFLNIENNKKKKIDKDFIEQITSFCSVPITVGGGINSIEDIEALLFFGADKITLNSALYDNIKLLELASKRFGSQTIVASIDYDKNLDCFSHSGKIRTNKKLFEWAIECQKKGAGEIMINCINNDGFMKGHDLVNLKKLSEKLKIPLIASGGFGNYEDYYQAFINGASAAAASSIFHFTSVTPAEIKKYLNSKKIPVRKNYKI